GGGLGTGLDAPGGCLLLFRLLAATPSGRGATGGAGSRLTWSTIVVARGCYDMAWAQRRPLGLRRTGDNPPMRSSRRLIGLAALLVLLSSPSGVASGRAQQSGARGHPFGASCYRVYVVNQRSDNLTLLDCTGRRLGSVGVGRNPHEVVVNGQGTRAYTSDLRAGTISGVSLVRQRRLRAAWVGGMPHGLSLGPDGRSLF